jgi:hypothetical protein
MNKANMRISDDGGPVTERGAKKRNLSLNVD